MRHQKAGVKLNRTSSHRNAMFRNMVTSLFEHGQIRTTDAKAKELRRWADKMITLAKRGDLHARRQAMAVIRNKNIVHRLFEEAQDRFGGKQGGYTRVIKLGIRRGDAAPISVVELVGPEESAGKGGQKPARAEKAGPKGTAVSPPGVAPSEPAESVQETAAAEPEAVEESSAAGEEAPEPEAEATFEEEPAPEGEVAADAAEESVEEGASEEESGETGEKS